MRPNCSPTRSQPVCIVHIHSYSSRPSYSSPSLDAATRQDATARLEVAARENYVRPFFTIFCPSSLSYLAHLRIAFDFGTLLFRIMANIARIYAHAFVGVNCRGYTTSYSWGSRHCFEECSLRSCRSSSAMSKKALFLPGCW